jgi:uncharacterized protein YceK
MKQLLLTLIVLSAALLSACANSIYRTPGSESASVTQLAVLEYNGELGAGGVNVVSVDGKHRGVGFFRRYELSPGTRSFTVALNIPGASTKTSTLTFVAAPAKTYELKYQIQRTSAFGGTWRVWIEDKQTGQPVAAEQG